MKTVVVALGDKETAVPVAAAAEQASELRTSFQEVLCRFGPARECVRCTPSASRILGSREVTSESSSCVANAVPMVVAPCGKKHRYTAVAADPAMAGTDRETESVAPPVNDEMLGLKEVRYIGQTRSLMKEYFQKSK